MFLISKPFIKSTLERVLPYSDKYFLKDCNFKRLAHNRITVSASDGPFSLCDCESSCTNKN